MTEHQCRYCLYQVNQKLGILDKSGAFLCLKCLDTIAGRLDACGVTPRDVDKLVEDNKNA